VSDWLATYKPAASARVHLLLAATLWTVVGAALAFFGGRWALVLESTWVWVCLGFAAVVGLAKGRFVLHKTADRIIRRIVSRGDGRCVGGFLSPKTWLVVLCMMAAGRLLRTGLVPRVTVGMVYVAVGVALLLGSGPLWVAWRRSGSAS